MTYCFCCLRLKKELTASPISLAISETLVCTSCLNDLQAIKDHEEIPEKLRSYLSDAFMAGKRLETAEGLLE